MVRASLSRTVGDPEANHERYLDNREVITALMAANASMADSRNSCR